VYQYVNQFNSYQVLFLWATWVWRRRLKCEKFTDAKWGQYFTWPECKLKILFFTIGCYGKNWGGGHLGFSICTKNSKLEQDYLINILQYCNPICPSGSEKKIFTISAYQNILLALTAIWNFKSEPNNPT
jgi:hypothetical protein